MRIEERMAKFGPSVCSISFISPFLVGFFLADPVDCYAEHVATGCVCADDSSPFSAPKASPTFAAEKRKEADVLSLLALT